MARIDLGVLVLLAAGACGRGAMRLPSTSDAGAAGDAAVEVAEAGRADQREISPSNADVVADALADSGSVDSDRDSIARATIQLSNVVVYADCMPTYPSKTDPIIASWSVSIEGAAGQPVATLKDATLTIVSSDSDVLTSLTQHLVVDSASVVLSEGAGSTQQNKTGADSRPPSVCMSLCYDATWSLDLTFDVGTARATGTFLCPM
jgi:hypothetical protein